MVKPANFATEGTEGKSAGLLAPLFGQLAKWFARYEAESDREEPDLPELLPVEDAVPAAEPAAAAAARGGGGSGVP